MSPIEDDFVHRLSSLPQDTQQLLLIAAAEPLGDMALLWRVASELGVDPDTSLAAERAGLIECKGQLRFLHPLVRAAAYRSASLSRRQRVHRALADATDPATEPDRRAWHRALASAGPSEEVAEELERSAACAQARGGLVAAAAFLERAHTITPQAESRARRGLAAASLTRESGSLEASLALLDALEIGPPSSYTSAEVECLRGQIAFDQGRTDEATRRLRSAAQRLEPFDPGRAREIHLESLAAAMLASGFQGPEQLHEAADAATAAPAAPQPPRVSDLLLDGLTEHLIKGYANAVPSLTQALTLMVASDSETDQFGRCWLTRHRVGSTIALELWDYESASALALRQVQVTRRAGAFVQLQFGLNLLATIELLAGRLSAAATFTAEDRMIAAVTGNLAVGYGDVLLAAFQGHEVHTTGLLRTVETNAAQGQDNVVNLVDYASAVLQNGLGRHDVAEQCAWRLFERGIVGHGTLVVSELAEAASRTGELAHLHAALEWLTERARVTPTDWALGVEARTRALLSVGDDCDRLFRESIERLSRTRLRAELARTHLLYGEWLRREGRRVDARAQLRTSHHMLADMGMQGFAERARRQLLATGETAQKRTVGAHNALTPQEGHIASLAGDGHTNPQIAVQLFISPRTVEWHLRKIFAKLDITSRRQLRGALPPVDSEIVPA